ncbi:LptF/LptG family permease [Candidatus Margulisiibacteriota bacterium]
MIKIIDKYIIKEIFDPFLFGLGAFSAILSSSMILFDLVREIIIQGMPLHVAAQVFIYKMPSVVVYIFPMATLLAALLAFARLSSSSEIIAFRSGGISLYRMMVPVLIFGLAISLITLLFYEVAVPEANKAAKNLMIETSAKHTPKLQDNVLVPEIVHGKLTRMFYANKLQGNIMKGVVVQEFTDNRLSQIINAKEAKWERDKDSWLFKDGIIYLISDDGEYKHTIKFKEQQMTIKYSPADFYIGERKPEEMNMNELKKYIALKTKMGTDTTDLQIQFHLKGAIPFACLVFALLGAPLGLSPQRSASSIGLGISVLIIFFYYVLTFIFMAIGELELLPPIIAAWAPNILTGGVGGVILYKAAQ